jgi:hypothetical protein
MENVPAYVSIIFIVTTFATIAILLQAIKSIGLDKLPSKILLFVLPLWIVFQTILSIGGFYQETSSTPPRIVLFGVLPAVLLIIAYLAFFREFVDRLPLKLLTAIHIVRIPVELTLFWLFGAGMVPQIMTFEGANFDIASGILAIIVLFIAFRGEKVSRPVIIAFNIIGLILLSVIVTVAALSVQSPMQQMSFDQPNRAVLFFPYVFLPTIIVPIVLASHLFALYKSLRGKLN